jgi:hypothetical protein
MNPEKSTERIGSDVPLGNPLAYHKKGLIIARFWTHIDKSGDCWLWQGSKTTSGYGKFKGRFGAFLQAHRFAYFLHYKVDPGALNVCHRCDTPACCNPEHLFLGTQADNLRDMREKGRGRLPAPRETVR